MEEIYYYPTMRKEFTREDSTGESLRLKGEINDIDSEFLEGITSETSALGAGALPSLALCGKDGEKSLAESLAGSVAKPKAKAKARAETPAAMEPTTMKQINP